MGLINSLRTRFQGLTDAILRFPLSILLFLATAVMNAVVISTRDFEDYTRLIWTFLVGAALSAAAQMAYEHFYRRKTSRLITLAGSAVITLAYFLLIRKSEMATVVSVRTMVLLFLLLVAFLWLPTIRSSIDFNVSFLEAFKAFWITGFFTGVLFLGLALILSAINLLLVSISTSAYTHTANIVFVLLAPLYFLSLIPKYPAAGEAEEGAAPEQTQEIPQETRKGGTGDIPGFLSNLLTYVIIPVTAVFTLILLIYILLNITEEFWTDNLLEPLLVSYSITVITVYLLVSRLNSPMAAAFRKVFPKILLPVVLFQTISSCLKIGAEGITYGRYYVILFGLFATVASLLFSFLPVRKNGLIAPILILLALLSIVPPIDAFTVSRKSQTDRLKSILTEKGMLSGHRITPNPDLSDKEKQRIVSSIEYLDWMQYTDEISWLEDYSSSRDFQQTFGFPRYGNTRAEYRSLYLYLNPEHMIGITGYDYLHSIHLSDRGDIRREAAFRKKEVNYYLDYERSGEITYLLLKEEETELLRLSFNDILNQFNTGRTDSFSDEITEEQARFTVESDRAILTLTIRTINIDYWQEESSWYSDAYLLIRIK